MGDKLKIEFNAVEISSDEKDMGMRMSFDPATGSVDAVSASANTAGFTPLTAVAGYYGWMPRVVDRAARETNRLKEVAILRDFQPTLFLVPHTKGHRDELNLIKDLVDACNACEISILHFTHYGMLLRRLPSAEIEGIFRFLRDNRQEASLREIIWDIDSRYIDDLKTLHDRVFLEKE